MPGAAMVSGGSRQHRSLHGVGHANLCWPRHEYLPLVLEPLPVVSSCICQSTGYLREGGSVRVEIPTALLLILFLHEIKF